MLQKLLKSKSQIIAVLFAVIGFALIRNYEDVLFYDPLLDFFKGTFSDKPLPEMVEAKLYLNLFLRYALNTILSLYIIYSLFNNKEFVKLAAFLYVVFFVILMVLFIIAIHFFADRLMFIFYVRRFIIQPIFLLLFVPGFYFQQYEIKKSKS